MDKAGRMLGEAAETDTEKQRPNTGLYRVVGRDLIVPGGRSRMKKRRWSGVQ